VVDLLITTSKNSSNLTKNLAKLFSLSFPESIFMPRGKRSLEKLIGFALVKHLLRVCIIFEKNKKPDSIRVLKLKGSGFEWAENFIKIKKIFFLSNKKIQKSESLKISGENKKIFLELFNPINITEEFDIQDEFDSIIFASKQRILIKINGKKVLHLGVKYEKDFEK
jgi:rRNA maturation protein Rpf1